VDALELQIVSALQRFTTLQRRATAERVDQPKLFSRALKELQDALEELRVAQEQLVENRARMEQMQQDLTQQYEKYWQLFDLLPQPYVVTKPDSTIVEANKAAADLFNISQRFLLGKTISVFVCEERGRFLVEAARVNAESGPMTLKFRLRPRERAPIDVSARVAGDAASLRWVLTTPDEHHQHHG
jgi:two-component system sensor histidine kinase VicK